MNYPNPAAAFDSKAREILERHDKGAQLLANKEPISWQKRGLAADPASSSTVCRILGYRREQWNEWTRGHKSPSHKTIKKWMKSWKDAGYPEISLLLEGDEVAPRLRDAAK